MENRYKTERDELMYEIANMLVVFTRLAKYINSIQEKDKLSTPED